MEEIIYEMADNWGPVTGENWEDMIRNPWTTATDPYVSNLFADQGWLFYAFLMVVTVSVAFLKSESIITPVATFLLMGALLAGMLTIGGIYYFIIATGAGIGIIIYMLVS